MPRKIVIRTVLLACLALIVGSAWWALRAQRGLVKAEQLKEIQLWSAARHQVERYLQLHPHDGRARLLAAEAIMKEGVLKNDQAAQTALQHLSAVPDTSPFAAQALTQRGRLEFLVLGHPAAGEKYFRAAIAHDPDSNEARYLLWKVYDQTERSSLAAPIFWEVYARTPESERMIRLREWYLSQFYPSTANASLDRMMGFLDAGESPSLGTEGKRLAYFKTSEPEAPLNHAALARWFHKQRDLSRASQILNQAVASLTDEMSSVFFIATLIGVSIDQGDFERAEACFAQWPEPHQGHEYWKWRAILLDEARGETKEAVRAYESALQIWPGPIDWRLRNRLVNCLVRVGRREEAAEQRKLAKLIEQQMEEDIHVQLRFALGFLHDPVKTGTVAAFYGKVGADREAACWERETLRLSQDQPLVLPKPQ